METENTFEARTLKEMIDYIKKEDFEIEVFNMQIGQNFITLNYKELQELVKTVANILIKMGVKKGDKIGLLSENRIEWPVVYLAVACTGAIAVPFDIFIKDQEIVNVIAAGDISMIFSSGRFIERVIKIKPQVEKLDQVICFDTNLKDDGLIYYSSLLNEGRDLLKNGIDMYSNITINPDDTAVMIFMHDTIFTMLTHKGVMSNAFCLIERLLSGGTNLKREEKWLADLPFYHIYPTIFGFIIPIIRSERVTIASSFKAEEIIKTIVKDSINYMATVPAAVENIYKVLDSKGLKIESLKFVISGGAVLDKGIVEKIAPLGVEVLNGYGLSEYSASVTCNQPGQNRPGTIGRSLIKGELKIDNPDVKGVGELLVKGPSIMKGYYKRPDLTEKVIDKDGWLHTGDIAAIDDEGFVWIKGRLKNIIVNKGGQNVYPEDIQPVLMKSSFIKKAFVIPKINPVYGECPYAVIFPDMDAFYELEKKSEERFSDARIRHLISEEIKKMTVDMASYKIPADFEIRYEKNPPDSIMKLPFMFDEVLELSLGSEKTDKESERADIKLEDINNKVLSYLVQRAAEVMDVQASDIDTERGFMDLMDSVEIVKVSGIIEEQIKIKLHPMLLFEYPCIRKFSHFLSKQYYEECCNYLGYDFKKPKSSESIELLDAKVLPKVNKGESEAIAIIGMSGVFPGSRNLKDFWNNLEAGKDLISELPYNRFDWCEYFEEALNKNNIKWGGFIDDIDKFDYRFFNIAIREAMLMDPQQRILLETVWKTIEDAGYMASNIAGSDAGIFVGIETNDYYEKSDSLSNIDPYTASGFAHSIAANRISYLLDIYGPSVSVATACSSSLTAVHLAAMAIYNKECEVALAAGVNAIISPKLLVSFTKAGMMAADGRCKTFSIGADGYVRGEGAGAIMLKPLSLAERDNDHIYAIIKGSTLNHGGRASSLTAPNPNAQANLLIKAYTKAGVSPDRVSYIETHGTGTELGDPVEIQGLKKAFEALYEKKGIKNPPKNYCGLGTVKTNIGHLETAAGIAGLIKTVLSINHKKIPGLINFKESNPLIDLNDTPFYLVDKLKDWQPMEDGEGNLLPLTAGVSSFGFGGANAHLIVEEYKENDKRKSELRLKSNPFLFVLSAKYEEQLKQYVQDMIDFFSSSEFSESDLYSASYTLQIGREAMEHRLAVIAKSIDDLIKGLKEYRSGNKRENLYVGNVKNKQSALLIEGKEGEEFLKAVISGRNFSRLACLWVSGVDLDWNLLYLDDKPKRLSMPTYPFARHRCWIEKQSGKGEAVSVKGVSLKGETLYFKPVWEKADAKKQNKESLTSDTHIIVFDNDKKLYDEISKKYRNAILVTPKKESVLDDNDKIYRADINDLNDLKRLIKSFYDKNIIPARIIYNGKNIAESGETALFIPLLFLTQALMEHHAKKDIKLLYLSSSSCYDRAISGFAKSLRLENPKFVYKTIKFEDRAGIKFICTKLEEEFEDSSVKIEVRYKDDQRFEKSFKEFDLEKEAEHKKSLLKEGGTYIITGGMGGLGKLFAEYLAKKFKANLVLAGRSEKDTDKDSIILELKNLGSDAVYIKADISKYDEALNLIEKAKIKFKKIDGIIHGAGVIKDASIANKTKQEADNVLSPKISGTINLDKVAKDEKLDFFVMFSSIAGAMGNSGQSDYAYANSFMDSFAEIRESLKKQGKRHGKTVSINWPLWKDGKMSVDIHTKKLMQISIGSAELSSDKGIDIFEKGLCIDCLQFAVLQGDPDKIRKAFMQSSIEEHIDLDSIKIQDRELFLKTETKISKIISEILKTAQQDIKPDKRLADYGFDSITLNEFAAKVSETYDINITPAIFLEHNCIKAFTKYLCFKHKDSLAKYYKLETVKQAEPTIQFLGDIEDTKQIAGEKVSQEPIAVIGISCRLPLAADYKQYWENLKKGRDCITNIPLSRWDWQKYKGTAKSGNGNIYCNLGGFIEDVDMFDPLFFGITPFEAKTMPPEERIMLEQVWKAKDDAGYTKDSFKSFRTGVFIGITTNTYVMLSLEKKGEEIYNSYSAIPNRISHFFDFTGPSIAIDTACSSSLTAVDMACKSIKTGRCEVAVAGGINLYLHPLKYKLMSRAGMLAKKRQRLLEKDSEGFIPGECAAAIILKPLSKAIEDKDHIYAAIVDSAVSHRGKSPSYMTPSPAALSRLIEDTLKTSQTSPEDIGYIELQSAGSSMVDSVEFRSFTSAYRKFTDKKGYCAAGSVSPYIGHAEAASGMAHLIKVLLMMKHELMLPEDLADNISSDIELKDSPFYINQSLKKWDPKPAGVISFGAGGSNAHLILKQYLPYKPLGKQDMEKDIKDRLIVVSASSKEQLKKYILELEKHIFDTKDSLLEIAFTLIAGREEFSERFAALASSKQELIELFKIYIKGESSDKIFTGTAKESSDTYYKFQDIKEAAKAWARGAKIDFNMLIDFKQARRAALPAYPFEKRRCWITSDLEKSKNSEVASYYDNIALQKKDMSAADRVHLVFAPFTKRVKDFSWILTMAQPDKHKEHFDIMLRKQLELKNTALRHADFSKVKKMLDIGCGFSEDIIRLALSYQNLKADGFTISKDQADIGQGRIEKEGLGDRVRIFNQDSSKDPFPDIYDLIIGFEVTFHIEDKLSLFKNIAEHLSNDGLLVLSDVVADTSACVNVKHLGQFTPTPAQFSENLAQNGLKIKKCIDVSSEIANYFYDPDFEKNLSYISSVIPDMKMLEQEHRGFARFGTGLEMGLFRYVLLTIQKTDLESKALAALNYDKFKNTTPYAIVLNGALSADDKKQAIETDSKATDKVIELISRVLEVKQGELDPDARFVDLGVDSLVGLKMLEEINKEMGLAIEVSAIYEYSSIRELSFYIADQSIKAGKKQAHLKIEPEISISKDMSLKQNKTDDIAIIGVSGRFPGAENIRQFWDNLAKGKDSITQVPKDRWDIEEYFDQDPYAPNKTYSRWGGFLKDIDKFDPLFFNISPMEAEQMDPQQRLFLEECWNALEDAGYAYESDLNKRTGVFTGAGPGDYSLLMERCGVSPQSHSMVGKTMSALSARISYFLNLKGPNFAVETACSSSLAAVHLACQSIILGEIDMAIAGGVSVMTTSDMYVNASKSELLSFADKCRSFDDNADGFILGEGVGVIVLKPLAAALKDRDHIYAVIKATGINYDGKTNGLTAPNPAAQRELASFVYEKAGINPETISYVEAHGTASKLGDPIEFKALTDAFRRYTEKKQYCAIGSVRTNIGHTMMSSCIASIIKVVLSMKYKKIPASLNFETPNKNINFKDSPFYVPTKLADWKTGDNGIRRAAVNAFGISGTNAHVVIEEYTGSRKVEGEGLKGDPFMFVLSARNKERLRLYAYNIAMFLEENKGATLKDIAWTLQTRRMAMEERVAIISSDIDDLIEKLKYYSKDNKNINDIYTGNTRTDKDRYKLFLSGETGSDYIKLAAKRKEIDKLAQLWAAGAYIDWNIIYPSSVPKHICLPTYPFERERYWIKEDKKAAGSEELEVKQDIETPIKEDKTIAEKFLYDLCQMAAKALKLKEIAPDINLIEYGFDSIIFTKFANEFNKRFNLKLNPAVFFECPDINSFVDYAVKDHLEVLDKYYGSKLSNSNSDQVADIDHTELKESDTTWEEVQL